MERAKKQVWVSGFNKSLQNAKSVLLMDFNKVTVKELEKIRKEAAKHDVQVKVIVNTLAKIAVQGTAFEGMKDKFANQSLVFISEDEVKGAALSKQVGDHGGRLKIVCLGLDNEVLNANETLEVADIPDMDVLRSKILGLITLSISKIPGAVQSLHSALARVISARASEEEKQ